jgi:glycerophosphoryl diester phosphodiesterase
MTAVNGESGTLRKILGNLRQFAWPLFLIGVFYRIIAVTLLIPLVSGLTWVLITGSGRVTIVNEEIATFLLEPIGLITLVVLAAVSLTLIALEQAGLMAIVFVTGRSGFYRALDALKLAFFRSTATLSLAGRIVLRVLLLGIPFLALIGLVYFLMLTGHDINYYLTLRPPAFKWALVLVALIGLGFTIAFIRLAAGVVLSLPILLFESKSAPNSLRESGLRTRGHHVRFATGIFIWAVTVVTAAAVTATVFVWLGRLLAPALVVHTSLLVLVFGGLFLSFSLSQMLVSMAATASFSLLVVDWYGELTPVRPDSNFNPAPDKNAERLPATRISGRVIIAGVLMALVLAMVTGWLLLSGADLKDRTKIMAHRGASAAAPENTMAAIEKAIADGAHWVEIDVQRTDDDHVVVVHDRDLMRVGNEPAVITEASYAGLAKVDIGSWFGASFADQRLPTLEQVLVRCKKAIKVNIELKYYNWDDRLAHRVIEIVEESGTENDIVVMSLQPEAVRQVKSLRPGWQVGLLSAAALTDLAQVEADFLAVHSRMATPRFVRRVQDAGKSLYVWTVNDPVGMMQMFDLGVDALITDKPALAAHLLAQRERLNPAERVLTTAGFLVTGEPDHVDPTTDGF